MASSQSKKPNPPVPRLSSAAHVFVDVFSGHWSNNTNDALLSPIPDCGVAIVPRSKRNFLFKDTLTNDSFDSTDVLISANKNVRSKIPLRRILTTQSGDDEKKTQTPFLERQEGVKKDVLSKGRSFLLEQQKRHRIEAKRTKDSEVNEKQAKVEKLQALSRKARQLVHETVLVPGVVNQGHGTVKVNDFLLFVASSFSDTNDTSSFITTPHSTYPPSDPTFLIRYNISSSSFTIATDEIRNLCRSRRRERR